MAEIPVQKSQVWVWLLLAALALVGIIGSCHPPSSTPSASLEMPSYPYDDFGAPQTWVLSPGKEEANLRDGPALSSPVVGQIEPGQDVRAIGTTKDSDAGWLVVRTAGGKIAYVKLSLMQLKNGSGSAAATFATSFDCTKATGAAEQLICQDEALAASDKTMSEVYMSVRSRVDAKARADLVSEQAAWVTERNQCVEEADAKACLSQQYQLRIITLQVTPAKATSEDAAVPASPLEAPATVG